MKSIVCIIPANLVEDANVLAEALGGGPNNYSVALSLDTGSPPTHYGLHIWGRDTTVALLTSMQAGVIPVEGFSPSVFAQIMSALIISIRESSLGHFEEVISGLELAVV